MKLAKRLAISQSSQQLLPLEDLPDPALELALAGVDIDARPYQQRIIQKAIQQFEGRYRNRGSLEAAAASVMIESPTGSGKTVMGLTIARYLQRQHGLRIGWVAMRRNLLAQAERENRARGFNVDLQLISMFDKLPPAVDVLIVDEAQHDAAMSMANLHCQVRPQKILGLTATPYRADRIKLCFDKVIRDAGIHQLIQDGYLSTYHHYTIPQYEPLAVAQCYAREMNRWGKSLMFFHRLEQCVACWEELATLGVRAEIVTAATDRERQLSDFADGRVEVLINMTILTEGFDCPSLKTVFCRPSGRGCTVQMAGRVLRKHDEHPFKQIVQCQKTAHPFQRTASAAEQYLWDGSRWRSLTVNAGIAAISQQARRLIASAQVELPKLVAASRTRSMPWNRERVAIG
jgi:superfamily II DNA or RNA helicase